MIVVPYKKKYIIISLIISILIITIAIIREINRKDSYVEYTTYYKNGNIRLVEEINNYPESERIRLKKEFYENGNLKYIKRYYKNNVHGKVKTFLKNGNLESSGYYNMNKLDSVWKWYEENGDSTINSWVNGINVGNHYSYENGNLKFFWFNDETEHRIFRMEYDSTGDFHYGGGCPIYIKKPMDSICLDQPIEMVLADLPTTEESLINTVVNSAGDTVLLDTTYEHSFQKEYYGLIFQLEFNKLNKGKYKLNAQLRHSFGEYSYEFDSLVTDFIISNCEN